MLFINVPARDGFDVEQVLHETGVGQSGDVVINPSWVSALRKLSASHSESSHDFFWFAVNESLIWQHGNWVYFPWSSTLVHILLEADFQLVRTARNKNLINKDEQDRFYNSTTNELDIPIIVDEAYFEYSNVNATKYLSEYKNLIILRTFSKAFGMSGLRLGYVIADPEIINELEKLRLAWSVNHFAVHAGITVLSEVSYFKKKIQEQKKIKEELYNLLSERGIQCYETDTNFLICKYPNHLDLVSHLSENRVLVNDVSHYPYSGDLLKNSFRINAPSEKDLNILKKLTF